MKSMIKNELKTCSELLAEYENRPASKQAENIEFAGVGKRDVYNISAPFEDNGEHVIAGRVEERDSEHAYVYFFVENDGVWSPRADAPIFELQDPFVTRINSELILGGVEIFPHPTMQDALSWRTVFYRGSNLSDLKQFATGPDGMKDLRLVQVADGRIGVFTRPQGEKGGRGKIGFQVIDSIEEFTHDLINQVPLLDEQFTEEEWGGANEIHLLSNGLLGVLGHIARFDEEGNRHYYSMAFVVNPQNGQYSDLQLIAKRSDFLPSESKRPDLQQVVFSGGLIRRADGLADLYVGISDASAQKVTIVDPFTQFEEEN
ncbi:hypothetical protein J14TS2_38010 [Bacillus sp. J14TS2]|nr:hypothetical protein J14TS2_38010 [Bacillus sp. J14TS2]